MSTPAAKRRRTDIASSTLSKPFRSPFKTPLKSTLTAETLDSNIAEPTISQGASALTIAGTVPQFVDPISAPVCKTLLHTSPRQRAPTTIPSPRTTASLNADPSIVALLRTQRELEKQLREVKEALDTADQARKIERESFKKDPCGEVDGDLADLITKWRSASRQAAEELFGQVRDRVNRMGGPRAWKEMQKRQQEFQNAWDQEEPASGDQGDADADEDMAKKAEYSEYDDEVTTDNEKSQYGNEARDSGELPGQEDEFTMAMMLKTLNVDLNVIRYDKEQQRWSD